MVFSKAVIVTPIVTEKDIAVFAVPDCLVSLLLVMVAVVAASTILRSASGEVCLAKAMCSWGVTRTAWSLPAGVVANQLFCQGNPELLHRFVGQIREITAENEAVGDHQIKQKPKNVLIVLPTF